MKFQSLTILGSTGSIGTQTLDVIRELDSSRKPEIIGLSAGNNARLLADQAIEFQPRLLHIATKEGKEELESHLRGKWLGKILIGHEGKEELLSTFPAELVVLAIVGWAGLKPALIALDSGSHLALANKEALVCAGHLVMAKAAEKARVILPVDSEHNAIHQCLRADPQAAVRRVILTCSGGPFRNATREEIDSAGPQKTLNHPTWEMGKKISVDSATLMNKGFEVIEAHHLFQLQYDQIDVVIHPQSTIHSMVEFLDGSIIAQLGVTDMRIPIQYAVTYPERMPNPAGYLDLVRMGRLDFGMPDTERFPALRLAYDAGRLGGGAPCLLNAANEVAVNLHLKDEIKCGEIPRVLEKVLARYETTSGNSLPELSEIDQFGRQLATEFARPRNLT